MLCRVKQNVRWKLPCLIVGVSHLVLICLSLYERIWYLVKLEEPFNLQDYSTILTSYLGNSYCIIPWLICTTPMFLSATLYAVLYMWQQETSQMLLNFVVVGVIWSTWYVVITSHLDHKRIRRK
ncbi:hypothetical protein NQ317_006048 [Molorchus minor]|uniref:Uncharacterized protein n=1 Tax=Molorchus minor TaxID=1323400 RepID=A0ABQ9K1T5_9CUCU|nr:hypothetical protein NQ317_006048 [Molorchus minor]